MAGVLVIFCRFGLDWAGLACGLPGGSGSVHLTISLDFVHFLKHYKAEEDEDDMTSTSNLKYLKGFRAVGLMIVHLL